MTLPQLLGLAFFVLGAYLFIGALLALLLEVFGERNPRSELPEWKVAGAIIVAWPCIFLGVLAAWEPLDRETL